MKNMSLIITCITLNVLFAILLIHKQNKMIALLYDLQKLQERQEQLEQQKKDLFLQLTKEQKLSNIKHFAQHNNMKPISIKEATTITEKRNHA